MSSFCNAKAPHIFSAKKINVSAIFENRNFNFSLMSLFMTNLSTAVANEFSNTLVCFCKNISSFCNAKAPHIFSAKNINVSAIFENRNFNFTLANNVLKF